MVVSFSDSQIPKNLNKNKEYKRRKTKILLLIIIPIILVLIILITSYFITKRKKSKNDIEQRIKRNEKSVVLSMKELVGEEKLMGKEVNEIESTIIIKLDKINETNLQVNPTEDFMKDIKETQKVEYALDLLKDIAQRAENISNLDDIFDVKQKRIKFLQLFLSYKKENQEILMNKLSSLYIKVQPSTLALENTLMSQQKTYNYFLDAIIVLLLSQYDSIMKDFYVLAVDENIPFVKLYEQFKTKKQYLSKDDVIDNSVKTDSTKTIKVDSIVLKLNCYVHIIIQHAKLTNDHYDIVENIKKFAKHIFNIKEAIENNIEDIKEKISNLKIKTIKVRTFSLFNLKDKNTNKVCFVYFPLLFNIKVFFTEEEIENLKKSIDDNDNDLIKKNFFDYFFQSLISNLLLYKEFPLISERIKKEKQKNKINFINYEEILFLNKNKSKMNSILQNLVTNNKSKQLKNIKGSLKEETTKQQIIIKEDDLVKDINTLIEEIKEEKKKLFKLYEFKIIKEKRIKLMKKLIELKIKLMERQNASEKKIFIISSDETELIQKSLEILDETLKPKTFYALDEEKNYNDSIGLIIIFLLYQYEVCRPMLDKFFRISLLEGMMNKEDIEVGKNNDYIKEKDIIDPKIEISEEDKIRIVKTVNFHFTKIIGKGIYFNNCDVKESIKEFAKKIFEIREKIENANNENIKESIIGAEEVKQEIETLSLFNRKNQKLNQFYSINLFDKEFYFTEEMITYLRGCIKSDIDNLKKRLYSSIIESIILNLLWYPDFSIIAESIEIIETKKEINEMKKQDALLMPTFYLCFLSFIKKNKE